MDNSQYFIVVVIALIFTLLISLGAGLYISSDTNEGRVIEDNRYNSNPLDEVIEPIGLNPSSILEVSIGNLNLSNIIRYDGGVDFPINESIMNVTIKNNYEGDITIGLSVKKFTDWEEFFWSQIWVDDGFVSSRVLWFSNTIDYWDYDFRDNNYIIKANETLHLKIKYKFVEQTHPFCFDGNGLPSGSYMDGQIYPGYIYINDGEYWHPYIFGIIT